jgi:hypothetical protein
MSIKSFWKFFNVKIVFLKNKKSTPRRGDGLSLSLQSKRPAGISTVYKPVAGLHRASPSTSLDKQYKFLKNIELGFELILSYTFFLVNHLF